MEAVSAAAAADISSIINYVCIGYALKLLNTSNCVAALCVALVSAAVVIRPMCGFSSCADSNSVLERSIFKIEILTH